MDSLVYSAELKSNCASLHTESDPCFPPPANQLGTPSSEYRREFRKCCWLLPFRPPEFLKNRTKPMTWGGNSGHEGEDEDGSDDGQW